jgi:sigma-B regulation protein RsbU (phosphoserine phosphatase)
MNRSKLKTGILGVLGRDSLKGLTDDLELEADRHNVDAMRTALSQSQRATPEFLAEVLYRHRWADEWELRDIAEEIQRQIFPQAPRLVSGYDIAGASFPAEHVAGDFIDYLAVSDESMYFAIGDVAGFGLDITLIRAAVSGYLQSLVQARIDPGEVLGLVNSAMLRGFGDRFLTMILGRFDLAARSFVYASAGHPSGYVLDSLGRVKATLEANGIPVGIDAGAGYTTDSTGLNPGDTLLLLTDGFIEVRSPAYQFFRWEDLLEVVRANLSRTAEEIIQSLHQAAQDFCQRGTPDDDCTAVVVKVES